MRRTVYTATDFPVDLNRPPDLSAVRGTARAMGGTFVTEVDITSPTEYGRHCRRRVPPSANRPPGAWPKFITEIVVPDQGLQPDPHGRLPANWIPPATPGAAISRVWVVTENPDGTVAIASVP